MHKPFLGAIKLCFALCLVCSCASATVWADNYYDAGLKSFQSKKFSEAAQYFEQSIKNAPWESNAFYYCALAYHYMGDFKKAAQKYGDCAERFPGTQACNQSLAALKVIDPDFLKRRKEEQAAAAGSGKGKAGSAPASSAQDKGTVEGQAQTRLFFKMNDRDKVVDVRVNGRSTRAIFDANGESTTFSRAQLASLGINPDKSATEIKGEIALGGVVRKNFPITVDDTGLPARIGNSFLDAFTVEVNDSAKTIDLKRKSGGGGAAAAVGFTRDGKSIIVSVDVNGHSTPMIFDPDASGDIIFTTQQAKSIGLRVDDAETEKKSAAELPVRGEPGWVPPEDRAPPPKLVSVRMKFGPIERPAVSCKVMEQGPKKPTFGPDFISSGGYKYDLDYKSSKITFTRK